MTNQMFDDWSPVMIYQKIREIDNALEQLWKRYCDDMADLLDEKQQLMDAISNKSMEWRNDWQKCKDFQWASRIINDKKAGETE